MTTQPTPPQAKASTAVRGVGLGLRRDLVDFLLNDSDQLPCFIECAPENWMGIGGYWRKILKEISERYPITCHGLSLSLGSPEPLDWDLLHKVRDFLNEFQVQIYSEHLSYSKCANAHLYDLIPIPFREDAIHHVAQRIREVQDFLERPIAIENVSYYTAVAPEMDEATFLRGVLQESNCKLLLDINNVYVNAFNHKYVARSFINELPLERVAYIHMAGHEQRSPSLIIDTHGAPIIDPVYELFSLAASKIDPVPVLLERDYNFPEPTELLRELNKVARLANDAWGLRNAA